jgi:uncharacterized membrane protein YbhN (UPF0104 family)
MWLKKKKISELIGYVLTFMSLVYIAGILVNIDFSELHISNPLLSLLLIFVFGGVASVSVIIGAYSWKLILEFVNSAPVSTKDVYRVYLNSNIAKYLPGNVMHYAGRNYLGSKLGWKNTEMALSSLLEYLFGFGLTGLIIVLFATAGFVNIPSQFELTVNTQVVSKYLAISILIGLTMVTITFLYRYLFIKEQPNVTANKIYSYACRFFTVKFLILLVKMFFITLGCFIINCIFYFYLCHFILDFQIRLEDFFNANAALSIASYASILTPGVPGGIGVKESVSILILSAYGYPKEILLLSLLVFRITCVLGDVFPFLMVKLFPK